MWSFKFDEYVILHICALGSGVDCNITLSPKSPDLAFGCI